MKSIVISFNDNSKIERLMALLEKLKIPFIIKEGDITVMNDPDIVWDWSDVDEVAFSKISEPAFAADWNETDETIWNNL